MDRTRVEKDWHSRGFSSGLWTDLPGQKWEGYVHEVDELLMVMEGELELEIGSRKLRPGASEEIFIPAYSRHSVRNIGGATARWLYGYRKREAE